MSTDPRGARGREGGLRCDKHNRALRNLSGVASQHNKVHLGRKI